MAILKQDYRVQVLMIGYDHRFGHNRSEGFEDYVRYGQELGIEVLLAQAYYLSLIHIWRYAGYGNRNCAADRFMATGRYGT